MTRFRPGSCIPISSRKICFSSSGRSEISASILAHTATTGAFSSAPTAFTSSSRALFSKPSSSTLATYMTGFIVRRQSCLMTAFSSLDRSTLLAGLPSLSTGRIFSKTVTSFNASLSPPERACLVYLFSCLSTEARSAKASSMLITEISSSGSTWPATWTILSSLKQRTIWAIASHSRILARNWFPRPSPLLAPATKPAISTNSTVAGTILWGETISANFARRGSGTSTIPTFGSIVQKG